MSPAQQLDLEKIERFYEHLEAQQKGQTPFIQASMNLVKEPQKLMQIMLIRHGVPKISRKGWFKRKEAQQFIKDYDSVGVYPLAHQPVRLVKGELDTIYTSNLNRAIHTAQLSFGDQITYVEDPQFAEFERKIIAFPNMKMPLGFWLVNSRLLWVLGLNDKGIENFKSAKKRARNGANFLATQAARDGKVVLVAHGFLNKYLRKYLAKQGWHTVKNGGQEHLGVSLLIKSREEAEK
ncbi:MAG: histidine phosphatase family protein [Flammeovirgaceae bacterium]